MILSRNHSVYLDVLTNAYGSQSQGIVKKRINLAMITRVEKTALHFNAVHKHGLILYVDPHGYTEIIPLPLSWNLFKKLERRGLFDD